MGVAVPLEVVLTVEGGLMWARDTLFPDGLSKAPRLGAKTVELGTVVRAVSRLGRAPDSTERGDVGGESCTRVSRRRGIIIFLAPWFFEEGRVVDPLSVVEVSSARGCCETQTNTLAFLLLISFGSSEIGNVVRHQLMANNAKRRRGRCSFGRSGREAFGRR